MEITAIKIMAVQEERLKAYVSLTFENCFVVRDIKIIKGNGRLFVAMPAKRKKDGSYVDIAHPLDQQTRERIEQAIFDAYNKQMEEGS